MKGPSEVPACLCPAVLFSSACTWTLPCLPFALPLLIGRTSIISCGLGRGRQFVMLCSPSPWEGSCWRRSLWTFVQKAWCNKACFVAGASAQPGQGRCLFPGCFPGGPPATCAHRNLLISAGLLAPSEELLSTRPFPDSQVVQGCALEAYDQHHLLGSTKKNVRGADCSRVAGAELDSTPQPWACDR